jgi:uncharacterized repeat protein (TIGR03803 family)
VFQLALGANGQWTEKLLHSFCSTGSCPNHPRAGLVLDPTGNLYGTTESGGGRGYCNGGCGAVFEITPHGGEHQ